MKHVEMIGPGGRYSVPEDKIEEYRRRGYFLPDEIPKASQAPSEAIPMRVLEEPVVRIPAPRHPVEDA